MSIPLINGALEDMQLKTCERAHVLLPKEWTIESDPDGTLVVTAPGRAWTLRVSVIFLNADSETIEAVSRSIAEDLQASRVSVREITGYYSTGRKDGENYHSYVLPKDSLVFIVSISTPAGEDFSEDINNELQVMLPQFFEADE